MLVVVAVDAFFPVVPGETAVITAAILAQGGDLAVWIVFLAAFLGALAGDNVSYLLGRQLGGRAARRLFRGEKPQRRLGWARGQLQRRGTVLVVGARFIPGGRTATTFSAGMLEMNWRPRFLPAIALGGALWAVYATALGYLGGQPFRDSLWKPLLVSLGAAGLVALAGEIYRRRRLEGGEEEGKNRGEHGPEPDRRPTGRAA